MSLKKQQQINYVIDKLSHWCSYVKLCNKRTYTDINLVSEGFIQQLLNILYNTNFIDLNKQHMNYPGIDLADLEKRIGVQITSRKDSGKITEAYKTINEKNIVNERIIFCIISTDKKTKFQKKTLEKLNDVSKGKFDENDIINISDLIQIIVSLFDENYTKFQEIYSLISRQIDTLPEIVNDAVVVEEILSCFNRPAFTVEFRDECNLGDFDEALKNTIAFINTGMSSDGGKIKYNVNDINSEEIRNKFSEIVVGINKLRRIFLQMKSRGYATKCPCGNPECKVIINNDYEFCCLMNDLRILILNYAWKISKIARCKFEIYPTYILYELGHKIYEEDDQGSLIANLEYIYNLYNKKLER